jgi:hypothetical protein
MSQAYYLTLAGEQRITEGRPDNEIPSSLTSAAWFCIWDCIHSFPQRAFTRGRLARIVEAHEALPPWAQKDEEATAQLKHHAGKVLAHALALGWIELQAAP